MIKEVSNKIIELISEYKFKVVEIENSETIGNIIFNNKDFYFSIQIEDEDTLSFGLSKIDNIDLSGDILDFFSEYGDLGDFEEFLISIKLGTFLYIKTMYKDIEKLSNKYEDNETEFKFLINYMIL